MIVQIEPAPGESDPLPLRLWLGQRPVEVIEILDQWPGTDHRYVKLRGGDGAVYIVRHDLVRGVWELILYQAADP